VQGLKCKSASSTLGLLVCREEIDGGGGGVGRAGKGPGLGQGGRGIVRTMVRGAERGEAWASSVGRSRGSASAL
jgi:hypothetical protein